MADEVADLKIMLVQVERIFEFSNLVQSRVDYKLRRLAKQLEEK
jgi:hypothetical protein